MELHLFAEFTLGAQSLTRSVPLWDTLPLYLFGRSNQIPANTPASQIEPRRHTFPYRDEEITIEIRPAILGAKGTKKGTRIFFPGAREELVAAAVRALAVKREAQLNIAQNGGSKHITVALTLRQIRAELSRTGHTFSHTEVVEALDILAKTGVTLTRHRPDHDPIHDDFTYYARTLTQDDCRIIFLNPVESQQIATGGYRAIRSDRLLANSDPIARWFFREFHNEHRGARKPTDAHDLPPPFIVTLNDLFTRGVLTAAKETRKSIARVRKALQELADNGVLHVTPRVPGFVEEPVKRATGGRAKVVDVRWLIYLSARTVDDIIDANGEAKLRPAEQPDRYSYLGPERITRAAEARQRLIETAEKAR